MAHRGDSLPFANREAAGRALSEKLGHYARRPDVVILGLPRGGVPVAATVARELAAPLDICLVRKIGAPWNPELALGAIASGGVVVWNDLLLEDLHVSQEKLSAAVGRARAELARKEEAYRRGGPAMLVSRHIAILVDDGLATGASMRAAAVALRARHPARVVVAAPVGSPTGCKQMEQYADEVICAYTPDPFVAVGDWYVDFEQVDDDEVRRLMALGALRRR